MSEPIQINLTSIFDGTTDFTLTREDLSVSERRVYTGASPAPGGVIGANFFGLFAASAPKLVGVSFGSDNPLNLIQVRTATGGVREQYTLRQQVQYVLMNPEDKLAIVAPNERGPLSLVVNELGEGDHVRWAVANPPVQEHVRMRIIRNGNFVGDPMAAPWLPTFSWDSSRGLLSVTDNVNNGPIPLASILYPRKYGALITMRYAGSQNNGELRIVENTTKKTWTAQTAMADVRWSWVQYIAHDDMITLHATNMAGGPLVADIEVLRVEPGDRLRQRFAAPQGTGFNL